MLNLSGQTPRALITDAGPRLEWRIGEETVQTNFDRFRPVGIENDGDGRLSVKWRDFADLTLDDPFYKRSIQAATDLDHTAEVFTTDWDVAAAVAGEADLLPFEGVIFHMARTGSTLIHRLIGSTGRVQSLSEIGVLDRILETTQDWPATARNQTLQTLVAMFRRARRPEERHFITKMTDSGASIRLPLFREAFPRVPWIFVYRDPVEVMVSAVKEPSNNTRNWYKNRARTARRLGMPAVRDPGMWPVEFVARCLRRFCISAVDAARATPEGLFLAVDYRRLPDAIWETVGPHFGLDFTGAEIDRMREEARYSSKKRERVEFTPDSDKKREEATPAMRRMAERFVAPIMEELKSLPQA